MHQVFGDGLGKKIINFSCNPRYTVSHAKPSGTSLGYAEMHRVALSLKNGEKAKMG